MFAGLEELDEDCRRILFLALKSPKTPPQMSKLAAIPITRCWEKIRLLEKAGLIRNVISYVGKNGRTVRYYESTALPDQGEERDVENLLHLPYLC